MTADSPQPPDDDLEPLRPRCDEFYKERSVSAYFYTRLSVLAAVNEHRDQFVAWANDGVRFHGMHIATPSVETDDTSDPPSAHSDPLQWYIQTETIALQHHALETLLRLYTGLIDASHWLDPLTAVTDRDRNLVELVDQHITSKPNRAMRDDVNYLLLGGSEVPDDDAERLAVIDNVSGILHVLARQWLDGRRPYNAIKHGLLISQSNATLSLGSTPDHMVAIGDGPSITYLNHTNWEPQPPSEDTQGGKMRRWSVDTRWIRFEQASGLIAVACVLIDCLWSLAVARWSESGTDEVRLAILGPDKINPRMLLEAGPPGQHMSWGLFTEIKPD